MVNVTRLAHYGRRLQAENGRNQIGKRQSDGSVWQTIRWGRTTSPQTSSLNTGDAQWKDAMLELICIWISGAKGNKSS
uniref:Uncharacterized protein n=1 Tax=Ditylenchus dipsaci TaxID=166011 RepID=A0A915CQD1_9BILA